MNPAWEKVLGFGLAELMSKPFLELVHREDVAATRKAIRTLSDGGRILDCTNRYRMKDGTYCQMMWSAAAAGDLIYAAARDVHSLSRQLHPSILEDLGLKKAVESECTRVSIQGCFRCRPVRPGSC